MAIRITKGIHSSFNHHEHHHGLHNSKHSHFKQHDSLFCTPNKRNIKFNQTTSKKLKVGTCVKTSGVKYDFKNNKEGNSFDSNSGSEIDSTLSYKFTDIGHINENEICILDDLTEIQMRMLVYEKIMKMNEVHSHKFHHKRRNSIEVSPEGILNIGKPSNSLDDLKNVRNSLI